MTHTVLHVQNLGKCYYQHASLSSRLLHWLGLRQPQGKHYWANQDVNFTVPAGQAIAIIGQNGAGKSTLLKMITGTVRPSAGQVQVHGRISAMLELGLGFNPEFTGRQNAYMAGGLMGFSQPQLDALMPEIESFADIGEFFEQPLRVYSSGMQARLAFAVATAVRPDVLIVDEILSVGDSYFQHRSFDRIRQFKEQGTSIILVTHSMGDVRSLCDHVILLDQGKVLKQGAADEVVDYYNALIAKKENQKFSVSQKRNEQGWLQTRSGTGEAQITGLRLVDANKQSEVNTAEVGQDLCLHIRIAAHDVIPELVLGLMLRDKQGHIIWGSNTWYSQQTVRDLKPGDELEFKFAFTATLGPGSYSVTTALTQAKTHLDKNYEWQDNALVFDVINTNQTEFIGCNWLNGEFRQVAQTDSGTQN